MRIGLGYDIHLLKEGRPLVIGGVTIPFPKGEEAHSDGDVLIHALIDALLGAAALGDIGTFYPPADRQWKDADSRVLLRDTMRRIEQAGYRLVNADCTVILERPKLGPWKEEIRRLLCKDMNISPASFSIKAKTKEGMDATGRGEAVEAHAAVLLEG